MPINNVSKIGGSTATGTSGNGGSAVGIDVTDIDVTGIEDFADDAAAARGGVPIDGLYRTGSALMVRVL